MSGEEDFFSVARTIPLVAIRWKSFLLAYCGWELDWEEQGFPRFTFDTEGGDTLIDSI